MKVEKGGQYGLDGAIGEVQNSKTLGRYHLLNPSAIVCLILSGSSRNNEDVVSGSSGNTSCPLSREQWGHPANLCCRGGGSLGVPGLGVTPMKLVLST